MFPVLFISREAVTNWRMLSLFSTLRIINPETHNQDIPISMLYHRFVFLKMLYTLPYSHLWHLVNSGQKCIQGEKELAIDFFTKRSHSLNFSPAHFRNHCSACFGLSTWTAADSHRFDNCLWRARLRASLVWKSHIAEAELHASDALKRKRRIGALTCICSSLLASGWRLAISHISVVYNTQYSDSVLGSRGLTDGSMVNTITPKTQETGVWLLPCTVC